MLNIRFVFVSYIRTLYPHSISTSISIGQPNTVAPILVYKAEFSLILQNTISSNADTFLFVFTESFMMALTLIHQSHDIATKVLGNILDDFNIPRPTDENGSRVQFKGTIPPTEQTKSQKICLSLVGGIPALACAVAAAQILKARGGEQQTVEIDLRRGHNYIDPDIGMTPSLNGQEITLDLVAGNPFSTNIFETRDGKWVVLSAVYVDLAYQWTALLECSMTESGVREAVKKWDASGA